MALGDERHEAVRHRDGGALLGCELRHDRGRQPLGIVKFDESFGSDVACGEGPLHCAPTALERRVEAFAFQFHELQDVVAPLRQLGVGRRKFFQMLADDLR